MSTYQTYTLNFKFRAGTSRGTLVRREIWILKIWDSADPDVFGLGEIAPLAGLSKDADIDYGIVLEELRGDLQKTVLPVSEEKCLGLANALTSDSHPALRFGLEIALLDLWSGGLRRLFQSSFTAGKEEIPINGLIWMGDSAFMQEQVKKKIEGGFSCIKMKIGSIEFTRELEILQLLRASDVKVIRVDANGAFAMDEALDKLNQLKPFSLHSIEQPIAPGQHQAMAALCAVSPVPIALDEELIGVPASDYGELLDTISPRYIILKPTLLGGITATRRWIREADSRGIGWWITSALESNIGLNAIAQLTAILNYKGHQGLGTGQLYENNFDSPLRIRVGHLHYDAAVNWNFEHLTIC